ncbi:MAG: sigma-70 family RNA polymerase sigma factor [Pseudomonadota bacterium]
MKIDVMRQELAQLGGGAQALALQILGNAEDAADAVHDSIATALGRPSAYDPSRGPLKPWFLRLVRNRCIDVLRRRRPQSDTVDELVEPSPGPEQIVADEQRDRMLKQALTSLSSDQRQIVILRDYMDLSYAEIAGVLEIATGTVMSRLHRARLALASAYRSLEGDRDD